MKRDRSTRGVQAETLSSEVTPTATMSDRWGLLSSETSIRKSRHSHRFRVFNGSSVSSRRNMISIFNHACGSMENLFLPLSDTRLWSPQIAPDITYTRHSIRYGTMSQKEISKPQSFFQNPYGSMLIILTNAARAECRK